MPEFFSNPGISGLKNANPGIESRDPGIESWDWVPDFELKNFL